MRRSLSRPWTPEDDKLIQAFAAKGATVTRTAAALRRGKETVQNRARQLGCAFTYATELRKKTAGTPNNEWWNHRKPSHWRSE
jgi:hypothetical protein